MMQRLTRLIASALLVVLFAAISVQGFTITSKTMEVKRVIMDDINNMEVAIFTVDADSPLFYNGSPLMENAPPKGTNSSDWSPLKMCWNSNTCGCMPPIVQKQLGLYTLNCGNSTLQSTPDIIALCSDEATVSNLPSLFLIPFPPAQDPFQELLKVTNILESGSAALENRISVGFYITFRDLGTDYTGSRFAQDFDFSTCELSLSDNITDANGESYSGSITGFTQPSYTCVYSEINKLATEMQATIDAISTSPDWLTMNMMRWKVPLLFSSNYWSGCLSLVTAFLESTPSTTQYDTNFCMFMESEPEWETDPCCNTMLLYEQCCVPTASVFEIPLYTSLLTDKLSACKNPTESKNILLDSIVQLNQINNLQSGCTAERKKVVSDKVYSESSAFLKECEKLIIGDESGFPICSQNSDCYTHCSVNSCEPPSENWNDVFSRCYVDHMNSDLARYLEVLWNVPANSTKEVLRQEFVRQMSDENCYGYYAQYLTDAGPKYNFVSNETCLTDKVCNWNSYLDEEKCSAGNNGNPVCGVCDGPFCYQMSSIPFCFMPLSSVNEEICASYGGVYDYAFYPYPCVFPGYSRDDCLPKDICPRYPSVGDDYSCGYSFCYLPSKNSTTCVNDNWKCDNSTGIYDPLLRWDDFMASGNGLCMMDGADEQTCESHDGVWYIGRAWVDEIYNSKETCNNICLFGDYYYLGLTDNECLAVEQCDLSCVSCASANYATLCWAKLDLCECAYEGGYIDDSLQACVLPYDKDGCNNLGYNFEACEDLSNDECSSCLQNPQDCSVTQSHLNCGLTRSQTCTQEQCTKSDSGRCNDFSYFNWYHPDCSNIFAIGVETSDLTHCFYSCRFGFQVDMYGNPYCEYDDDVMVNDGCLNQSIIDEANCTYYGGEWIHRRYSYDTCTHEEGCRDTPSSTIFSGKSPEVCESCGGEFEPVYSWLKSNWTTGAKLVPMKWAPYEFIPVNMYGDTLNFGKVYETIEKQIALRYASYFQTELLCRYSGILDTLRYVTCDCSGDPNVPSNCYSSSVRVISAGMQRFCSGLEDWVKTGSYSIKVSKSSVPLSYNCINTNISVVPASQFRRNIPDSVSSDQLSGAANQEKNNPYNVIKYGGEYVGQITSDGLVLEFVGQLTSLYVCSSKRSDITVSKAFSHPDFVIRNLNGSDFVPMGLKTEKSGDSLCAYLTLAGGEKKVIFPAMLYPDWDTYSASTTSHPFVYAVAGLDFVLALCSLVQIVVMLFNAAFITRKFEISVQKILHGIILVFTSVRGTYILLVAMDKIVDGSLQQILLYDLPTLLFFTAYSCLLFFWAEITSNTRGMRENLTFVSYLRPLLYQANGAMYIFFVVVVILSQTIDQDHIPTVKGVYYYFLASIALLMSVGFSYYGIRLWKTMSSLKIAQRSERQKATLRKIAIVTTICTLSFLFQCTYLVVILYVPVNNVNVALIPFLLAEFVPCALILFSFRNNIEARVGSSNSGRSLNSLMSRLKSGLRGNTRASKDTNMSVLASIGADIDV